MLQKNHDKSDIRFQCFSLETTQTRRLWGNIIKILKGKKFINLYPAKIPWKKRKTFSLYLFITLLLYFFQY